MIWKGLVKGIAVQGIEGVTNHVCKACIKAKMTSLPFSLGHKHATRWFEQLHSDLCGEFKHPSLGGDWYLATLIKQCDRQDIAGNTLFLQRRTSGHGA